MLKNYHRFGYFIVSNYLKMKKPLPSVYLDISIDNKHAGRLGVEVMIIISYLKT